LRRRPATGRCCQFAATRDAAQAARLDAFLRTLAREGDPDLAGLALAVRQLGSLL
jgi:hypothetical protein